jgi:hypothetical protein
MSRAPAAAKAWTAVLNKTFGDCTISIQTRSEFVMLQSQRRLFAKSIFVLRIRDIARITCLGDDSTMAIVLTNGNIVNVSIVPDAATEVCTAVTQLVADMPPAP